MWENIWVARAVSEEISSGTIGGIKLKGLRLGPQSPYRLKDVPCTISKLSKGAKRSSQSLGFTKFDSWRDRVVQRMSSNEEK